MIILCSLEKGEEMSWYPNGYVSGAKPTFERMRQHRDANLVWRVIMAVMGEPRTQRRKGQESVTRLPSLTTVVWCKKSRRYRYDQGTSIPLLVDGKIVFKNMGGKYARAPANAPPERKKGYKKPPQIARLKSR